MRKRIMESATGIKYEELKKGNYLKQLNHIIKKYFDGYRIFNGNYQTLNMEECYLFFRGQSNFSWKLEPVINRGEHNEAQILESVLVDHPEVEKEKAIAYAQHYGKPTRAIDFTSDLKVALYFACNQNPNEDGAVYIAGYIPHQNDWISSLTINLISQMKTDVISDINLAKVLMENEKYKSLYYMRSREDNLSFVCAEYSSFLNDGFIVVYDYAKEEVNNRMKLQKGSLFYCGSKYYVENEYYNDISCVTFEFPKYEIHLHEIKNPTWLKSLCVKVKIPKSMKKDILLMTGYTDEILGL